MAMWSLEEGALWDKAIFKSHAIILGKWLQRLIMEVFVHMHISFWLIPHCFSSLIFYYDPTKSYSGRFLSTFPHIPCISYFLFLCFVQYIHYDKEGKNYRKKGVNTVQHYGKVNRISNKYSFRGSPVTLLSQCHLSVGRSRSHIAGDRRMMGEKWTKKMIIGGESQGLKKGFLKCERFKQIY